MVRKGRRPQASSRMGEPHLSRLVFISSTAPYIKNMIIKPITAKWESNTCPAFQDGPGRAQSSLGVTGQLSISLSLFPWKFLLKYKPFLDFPLWPRYDLWRRVRAVRMVRTLLCLRDLAVGQDCPTYPPSWRCLVNRCNHNSVHHTRLPRQGSQGSPARQAQSSAVSRESRMSRTSRTRSITLRWFLPQQLLLFRLWWCFLQNHGTISPNIFRKFLTPGWRSRGAATPPASTPTDSFQVFAGGDLDVVGGGSKPGYHCGGGHL